LSCGCFGRSASATTGGTGRRVRHASLGLTVEAARAGE
jgi:hypothetical protein